MEVKVCGMRQPDNIRDVAALGVDYVGLIFHDASPRNAAGIDAHAVAEACGGVSLAGVFVNRPEEEIVATALSYGLAAVQLHGDESPEQCSRLMERGLRVWKAVGVDCIADLEGLGRYDGCVERFVFDRKSAARGGTGKKFDWRLLDAYQWPVAFMLGGGVGPEDAGAIAALRHPQLIGVDLNSRFELAPGLKDCKSLGLFINKIKKI